MKQPKNIGLFVSDIISFNQDTETRQVKYDNEDVGTILIDRATGKKKFRTRAITIDGLYRIAEWVDKESFALSVKVKEVRRRPSPVYQLCLIFYRQEKFYCTIRGIMGTNVFVII